MKWAILLTQIINESFPVIANAACRMWQSIIFRHFYGLPRRQKAPRNDCFFTKNLRIINLLLILFLYSSICNAASTREDIETKIAHDNGFDHVILIMPSNRLEKAELVEYRYTEIPGRVIIILKDNNGATQSIKARFEEAVMVPSPEKDVERSEKIDRDFLTLIKVPKSKAGKSIIVSEDQLIDTVAKRKLYAKKFININDVAKPDIIAKGKEVKMVYNNRSLQIESRGIALEPGTLNSFIKVRTIDSNKSVMAQVFDEETVIIGAR
jgi:flagella basal body P-ring formation protein FlgA